jgi:hypothetical protein
MKKQRVQKPYLFRSIKIIKRKYNPEYGDNRICKCGHPYGRHFDSYQLMRSVGCKYCDCCIFKEKKNEKPM